MKFKAILGAMVLFGLIFATCACKPGSDPEIIQKLIKQPAVPPPQINTYTTDTDKDTLPDELENGETDFDSWRTDDQLDIYRVSTGSRADREVFNRAYDRYKRAVLYLVDHSCAPGSVEMLDTNANGSIDTGDNLMGPDGVECEDDDTGYLNIRGVVTGPAPNFLPDEIIVTAFEVENAEKKAGAAESKLVTIEAKLVNATYMEFQRFSGTSINYGGGYETEGSIHAGGYLGVNNFDRFGGDVYIGGVLNNAGAELIPGHLWENVQIDGTLVENFPWVLSLDIDDQMASYKTQAAASGWLINNANGLACLSDSKAGGSNNLLVLDYFKCLSRPDWAIPASSQCDDGIDNDGDNLLDWDGDGSTSADTGCLDQYDLSEIPCHGVPPHYDSPDCPYDPATQTGAWILPDDFNGIIYWDNGTTDIHVEGRFGSDVCDGNNCGKSVGIFSDESHIYMDGWITAGSDIDGNPINVGLVVSGTDKETRFIKNGPIFMRSNVAMMSSRDTWRKESGTNYATSWSNYNLCFLYGFCTGMSFDINDNGSSMENPNSWGWNELFVEDDDHTNLLFHKGPIITAVGGFAGMWSNPTYFKDRITRAYTYDPTILDYPPPFPKIPNLYRFIEMTVVLDGLE